ncbi:MAG: glutamine-hydrolyzing GMP synthase [Lachnospiraceae bacterium]|nr:glutamine-hydrolyzing GMP synthase [Lachnospiraceae bacterium]
MAENVRPETMARINTPELAKAFIDEQIDAIRAQVGDKKVLLALSGGVDSSVCAALISKAIGKQLVCVHVNHGLLRKGEPEQVCEVFGRQFDVNLVYVDAIDRFLDALAGVSDPETKRKIIGKIFIDVFAEEARKLEGVSFLGQGTIYPDILESHGVKAHHNVGGLPEDMRDFELVEPVKFLYKDEVRCVGHELGLPDNMVYRQPFPGPGLGVRCVGAITRDRLEALREADAIVREEIGKLPETPWQYFCAIPDIQSTGIKYVDGRGERYMGWAVVIRAVNTVDAVTATVPEIPFDVLCRMRDQIVQIPGVNRVLWDISEKPVATIEWE